MLPFIGWMQGKIKCRALKLTSCQREPLMHCNAFWEAKKGVKKRRGWAMQGKCDANAGTFTQYNAVVKLSRWHFPLHSRSPCLTLLWWTLLQNVVKYLAETLTKKHGIFFIFPPLFHAFTLVTWLRTPLIGWLFVTSVTGCSKSSQPVYAMLHARRKVHGKMGMLMHEEKKMHAPQQILPASTSIGIAFPSHNPAPCVITPKTRILAFSSLPLILALKMTELFDSRQPCRICSSLSSSRNVKHGCNKKTCWRTNELAAKHKGGLHFAANMRRMG